VLNFLLKNERVIDHIKWSHHVLIDPNSNRRTIIAMHPKDLPTWTLMAILRQTWFSKEDLEK
jgi:predicted RNA binding protein YcfA (HicA-like mRNA interferase family)